MTAPFKPPRGVTVEFPYRTAVLRADPDFEYGVRHQLFYEFANGRKFFEDENQHGAYLPSGPASANLSGVRAIGGAGMVSADGHQTLLVGVSAIGSVSHVTGIGTEDDVTLFGVVGTASAGVMTTNISQLSNANGDILSDANGNLLFD